MSLIESAVLTRRRLAGLAAMLARIQSVYYSIFALIKYCITLKLDFLNRFILNFYLSVFNDNTTQVILIKKIMTFTFNDTGLDTKRFDKKK